MTFCEKLREAQANGKTVSAYKKTEKYSCVPRYEIIISEDAIAREVIKTAKSTWPKAFERVLREL